MDTWIIPQTQIVIVNYDKFGRAPKNKELVDGLLKRKFDMIILDEAHKLRGIKTATTKMIQKLHTIPHKLCLTGTPAYNRPTDIFAILRFLDASHHTSYWKWCEYWCEMEEVWTRNGVRKNPTAIKKIMRPLFVQQLSLMAVQRKRADVMPWLTDVEVIDVPIECSKIQKKYLDELELYYSVGHIKCQGTLDRLIAVRHICNDPAIIDLKHSSPKQDWLLEFIRDNEQKQILVFGISKRMLKKCKEFLESKLSTKYKIDIITGDVSPKKRMEIVSFFQQGYINLLFLQTQACAAGLTLDSADVSIFLELYPPASDYTQAKDRMIPTDATRVKDQQIYRLFMKDTFDASLVTLVDSNVSTSDVVNSYKEYLERRKR